MSNWKIVVLALLVNLFMACETNVVYSRFEKVDANGWLDNVSIPFSFEITDTNQPFDLCLSVRHDKNYEFSNLWLKITDEQGKIFNTDFPVQLKLANKSGQWLGKCSNTYCLQNIVIKQQFVFPDTGKYTISVFPYMRTDQIMHIKAVGISLTKYTSL